MFELILAQALGGLVRASFLFLVTAGLTLIYGYMSVLNLAHVSFYMLGAYFAATLWRALGSRDISYWVSIPLTVVVMGLIGVGIEFVLMRRLRDRLQSDLLVATFALILIFTDVARIAWGNVTYSITKPAILTQSVASVGFVDFPASTAFTLGMALLVGFFLWFWLQKTRFGRIVRATQSHREMVAALGIPVPRIYAAVFTISVALAGLAGAIWLATGIVQPGMLDLPMLPLVFCVMVIGGMGSLVGTALASIIAGEAYAITTVFAPRAAMLSIYAVTFIVLVIRPWGLLGTRGRLE